MALDKVVDSAALDAGLTAIADAVRGKTGGADALAFPGGMVDAIAGIFGGSGGAEIVRGTFTPAEDTMECRITGLDGSPSAFAVAPAFTSGEAYNGVAKLLGFFWVRGVWVLCRTNAGGTSGATDSFDVFNFESFTVQEDDYDYPPASPIVAVLKTGFLAYRNAYYFRAGLTYNWAAII